MYFFALISTFFFLLGCSSFRGLHSSKEIYSPFDFGVISGVGVKVPGRFYTFSEENGFALDMGENGTTRSLFRDRLKSHLEKAGFTYTKDRRNAHLEVWVWEQPLVLGDGETYFSQVTRRTIKGVTHIHAVEGEKIQDSGFSLTVNRHGKRPEVLIASYLRGSVESFQDMDAVSRGVERLLTALKIEAPASNEKMKGPPGCTPRFGYDYQYSAIKERQEFFVSKIQEGSPAARAGLKVGDQILSMNEIR